MDTYPIRGEDGEDGRTPGETAFNKPIDAERYFSKNFMALEWARVWTKTWQIAGLVQQVRNPGDYFTTEFGREVILCVRGRDGTLRAFHNVCQHRGMLLVAQEEGNAPRFTCPYHFWNYDLSGKLVFVPDVKDFAQGNPCGKRNLIEIPCGTWGGLVWFNLDAECRPLAEYLEPIAADIDRYPMEEMRRTNWVTVEGDWNWKLVQDNFAESYHVPFLHPHLKYVLEYAHDHSSFEHLDNGHARMLMPGGSPAGAIVGGEDETFAALAETLTFWDLDPEAFKGRTQDIRAALIERRRALGTEKGFDFSTYSDEMLTDFWHYTIFPNVAFSLRFDGNIISRARPHPTDPEKCLYDMWFMSVFPKGQTRHYALQLREWIDVDAPVGHVVGAIDEVFVGPTIKGDMSVWPALQKALHSSGYRGTYLAGQESRVRHFHNRLESLLFS
jgi:phenylpropionate dioxygenase-like ring-hydroxylating dioxygenase large terminal subunit